MKRIYSLIAVIAMYLQVSAVEYCASSAWGYGAGVTGGGNATPTLVSSVSQLQSALNKAKNKVIIITQDLTFTTLMSVQDGSNVTLMAMPGVTLTSKDQTAKNSGILFVKRFNNIIIRNITFVGPGAYDCDGNDLLCFENTTKAWVDHCDFQDGCDGNFDNKANTDNVTVSWCRFRYLKQPKSGGSGGSADHRFTNLLGAKSSDAPSDGTYNFTWAYCWWDEGCKERMVRCRNAELHFLNCYWNSSVANYYVGPENAKAYFEGCTFAGKANTSKLIFKSYGGTNACKFVNCTGNLPSNSGSVNAPSYSYDKITPATAKSMVTNSSCGAGATLNVTLKGEVSSSCDGGSTPPVVTYYTVTWDAKSNGGSCETGSSLVESGDAIGTLPTASRSGYDFNGWFTSKTGGTKITATTKVTSNVTYYAQFTEQQSGGGGGDPTPGEGCDTWGYGTKETNVPSSGSSVTSGSLTVKNVGSDVYTGTVFSGSGSQSAIKANGSGKYVTGTLGGKEIESITFSISTSANDEASKTAYVIVFSSADEFSTSKIIQVDGANGYVRNAALYSAARETVTITAPSGTKSFALGRNISGASIDGAGSSGNRYVYYIQACPKEGGSTPPVVTYTLSYDENGGSGTMSEQTGTSVKIAANGFTAPAGYSFKEWNDNSKGAGTTYTAGNTITLTADLVLYAVWEPKQYTVTLNAGEGTGGTASVKATFDEVMPNITIPSRNGFIFKGYFSEANGTGTQYYDGNGSSTNSWTTAGTATLYAYWEEKTSSTPVVSGDLKFWFFHSEDATANNVANDGSFFSNMVSSGSSLSGSIAIDGTSYQVTRRTGDNATFGQFTVPEEKAAVFYALAVSSGSGSRQISLTSESKEYILDVAGGSSDYKRIESDTIPAGTYRISRVGGSNVRLGVVVVKLVDASSLAPVVPANYTVTWDAATNGGSCLTATSIVEENSMVGTLPEATKEGYTFDGWFTSATEGAKINAQTIINEDVTFYAQFTKESSGSSSVEALYYWQMSGTTPPANDEVREAVGGTISFRSTDPGKYFTVESIAYNASVPEDMKSAGSKGLKHGVYTLYMVAKLASGSFKAGDTIYISGYLPWQVSSDISLNGDLSGSITTGTGKTNYQVGYAVLAKDADSLYISRATASSSCIAAVKVCRPSTVPPVVKRYTITWVIDGKPETEQIEEGKLPVYSKGTPTKAEDAQYTYSFKEWTPEIVAVTGDATYTAVFTATAKTPTGVVEVQSDNVQCTKVIKDGTLYILRGEEVYDILGKRIK